MASPHPPSNKNIGMCPRCDSVARRGCCSHPTHDIILPDNICPNCRGFLRHGCCSRTVDHHWKAIPPRVKEFILGEGHLSKDGFISAANLVAFWSSPNNIDITKRVDICGATLYLALLYLKLGLLKQARALIINGAFANQCIMSSVDYIKKVCSSNADTKDIMKKLPHCAEGFYATETAEKMESFITRYLPQDYQNTMTNFANLSTNRDIMDYAQKISDDFSSTYKKSSKRQIKTTGKKMAIIFMDADAAEGGRNLFQVLSSTILKVVFTDYAKERGISLRSLRFSYNGKTLFLSQVGKKNPEELGIKDQDVIDVFLINETSPPQAPQDERSTRPSKKGAAKAKRSPRPSKARKATKSIEQEMPATIGMTQEELRIEHSKVLTKLHEELQPKLTQIRRRLNNLLIERSEPKSRSAHRHPKSTSLPTQLWVDNPCQQCIGGKAGKSYFIVQVGDVGSLYKTQKSSSHIPGNTPALDLHGHTKDEALATLDENLNGWVETAMQGSYPFVIQVKIICGCGSQTLSEVVEKWIKSKSNVSNAPKKR